MVYQSHANARIAEGDFQPALLKDRTHDGDPRHTQGLQADRDFADAIGVAAMRFFVGLQGHPELMARHGRPHPLLLAFRREAAR